VIDTDGTQLGILPTAEAIRLAKAKELDVVEVSPQASPPVCKIMDFGKFKYAQSKKEREGHKKRKSQQLKEVKLRPKIDPHDFQTKSKLVTRLIGEGDKVKVTITFRGREIIYASHGQEILEKLAQEVSQTAVVERPPKLEGKIMMMILSPKGGGQSSQPPS
jgi:translation initiation factor IF-3